MAHNIMQTTLQLLGLIRTPLWDMRVFGDQRQQVRISDSIIQQMDIRVSGRIQVVIVILPIDIGHSLIIPQEVVILPIDISHSIPIQEDFRIQRLDQVASTTTPLDIVTRHMES